MNHKQTFIVTLGSVIALTLLPAFWPSSAAAHTCDDPFSTDLIAGKTIDAGNVKVCNDDTTLSVTYEATFPWCLLKTDLHVATSSSAIPQTNRGNPKPDEFAYGEEYGGCLDGAATFDIPLDDIDGGVSADDAVFIAAHALVNDGERTEGAWAAGTRFVQRGDWATYFSYVVQEEAQVSSCDGGFCVVFVTSTTHTGNLGGLTGADNICQNLADADGSLAAPGNYKAWLSDSVASPSTRFTQATVPYKRVDGTTIADDWNDLVNCTPTCLDAPLSVTEVGGSLSGGNLAWTDTQANGEGFTGLNCTNWSSEIAGSGVGGDPTSITQPWTGAAAHGCIATARLYCFQQ